MKYVTNIPSNLKNLKRWIEDKLGREGYHNYEIIGYTIDNATLFSCEVIHNNDIIVVDIFLHSPSKRTLSFQDKIHSKSTSLSHCFLDEKMNSTDHSDTGLDYDESSSSSNSYDGPEDSQSWEDLISRDKSSSWEINFHKLAKFEKMNGHCNVPVRYKDNGLALWVRQQRNVELTTIQRSRLEEIGFSFRPVKTNIAIFEQRIGEMSDYKTKHGNCNFPARSKLYRSLQWFKRW